MSTDFNKLVDLNLDQLNALITQYETSMEKLRSEISKVYEKAEPYLLQIRELKKKYKELGLKFEATKTFIQMEKGGSLVSSLELHSLHQGVLDLDSPPRIPRTPPRGRLQMSAVETASRVVRKLSKSPTKIPPYDAGGRKIPRK